MRVRSDSLLERLPIGNTEPSPIISGGNRRGASSGQRCAPSIRRMTGYGIGEGVGGRAVAEVLSALPPKADKEQTSRYVRFVPKADSCTAAKAGRRQIIRQAYDDSASSNAL